jgi:hypothetical protein
MAQTCLNVFSDEHQNENTFVSSQKEAVEPSLSNSGLAPPGCGTIPLYPLPTVATLSDLQGFGGSGSQAGAFRGYHKQQPPCLQDLCNGITAPS